MNNLSAQLTLNNTENSYHVRAISAIECQMAELRDKRLIARKQNNAANVHRIDVTINQLQACLDTLLNLF